MQRLQQLIKTQDTISSTILRVPIGIVLAAHGAQKLFGWFGGYGLEGTGQWMESIGLAPGFLMALMAGSAEFFAGLALVIGLLTRPAAMALAFTMVVAIFSAHWQGGLFLSNNGYEYALVLLAATASLAIQGAGKFSMDSYLTAKLNGQQSSERLPNAAAVAGSK